MARAATRPNTAVNEATKVAAANVDDIGVDAFVIHNDAQGVPVAHRVKLGPDAGTEIVLAGRDYLKSVVNQTLLAYGPAKAVPDGHSLYLDQARAVNLVATENSVTTGNVDDYNPRADYAKRLKLMAVRLSLADGSNVTLYRVLKPLYRFGRSRVIALVQQDGQYNRLDPQDLLLFDLQFDVLVAGGVAIFELKATFERAFGFLEELKKNSRTTFRKVTKGLRIKGIAELEAACTTMIPMMNKLASISRAIDEDPDYARAMTMDKLLAFIKVNPSCGVDIDGVGAKSELVFDKSPQKRFKILNLLDDDFLHSTLTDRNYEANSKSRAGS
jgi:hypothetical protein